MWLILLNLARYSIDRVVSSASSSKARGTTNMNFLGLYNLFMALAIAGAIGICQYPEPASGQDSDSVYVSRDGGQRLPPAAWVINRPPTRVDNGYWTGFYWNRVDQESDEDVGDDDGDDEGGGYGSYGPYGENRMLPPAYESGPVAAADAEFEEAANNVYGGDYNTYGTDYYAGIAIDEGATYRRPVFTRVHRDHRDNRVAHERHDDNRMDADRVDHSHAHAAATETHAGYNGHDRKMFEGDHRPAKQVSAGHQVHGGNGDRHHDHQQK
jgi:hypothetical protein